MGKICQNVSSFVFFLSYAAFQTKAYTWQANHVASVERYKHENIWCHTLASH